MPKETLDASLAALRFLTEATRYRLTEQHASQTGDVGHLLLESDVLQILFGWENGRFFLDIASAMHANDPDDWYDLPLVRRLFDEPRNHLKDAPTLTHPRSHTN